MSYKEGKRSQLEKYIFTLEQQKDVSNRSKSQSKNNPFDSAMKIAKRP